MGIRPVMATVYGIQITSQEKKAFLAWMKANNYTHEQVAMLWIEYMIKQDQKAKRFEDHNTIITCKFMKRSMEDRRAVSPLQPFWKNDPKLYQQMLKRFNETTRKYNLKFVQRKYKKDPQFSDDNYQLIQTLWIPEETSEDHPSCILGWRDKEDYYNDIAYSLFPILKCGMKDKIIEVPGQYPWEVGTTKTKEGQYFTFNAESMIPIRIINKLSKEQRQEYWDVMSCRSITDKQKYITEKKAVWDKFHGNAKPYKTFPYDGWHGSDFWFYPVDSLFQMISKYVPEIKYDVLRLTRYLCLYWR